jgi:hypothetical protein
VKHCRNEIGQTALFQQLCRSSWFAGILACTIKTIGVHMIEHFQQKVDAGVDLMPRRPLLNDLIGVPDLICSEFFNLVSESTFEVVERFHLGLEPLLNTAGGRHEQVCRYRQYKG